MKKSKSDDYNWPKVSFILLTLNGGSGVERCLKSLARQDYPKKLIDTVVVDNGSKDNSVSIAKRFGARVYVVPNGNLYSNWMYGVHRIKGSFVFYLEQDIEIRRKDFIKQMVKPMLNDKRLIATFTKEQPNRKMHWAARYLSYHYAQCDPLLEMLFDRLESKIIEDHKYYSVCKFDDRLQPAVRMFYRTSYLKKTPNWKAKNYFDHDFVINCVKNGYPYFAYVPEPGYYHYHVVNFKHLLQKRSRNMYMHFFDNYDKGAYTILDIKKKKNVIKLILFFLYANTLLPAALRGFIRFIKHKDTVLLMEPIVTIAVCDSLLFTFLKDKRGRKYITKAFQTLLK